MVTLPPTPDFFTVEFAKIQSELFDFIGVLFFQAPYLPDPGLCTQTRRCSRSTLPTPCSAVER